MRRIVCSVMLVAAALGSTAWAAAAPETWEGPLLKPAPRKEVFEFTRKPTFRNVGKDRYEVSFASKAKCDVAVAIHDAKGKLVRHIVAGVLGSNAPEPLRKDSLDQTIIWDGKDDFGKYVEEPETCTARVSLGLSPTFDKLLGWHPYDMTGPVLGIGADKDGVYVFNHSARNQVKRFDHDGRYVCTIYPWPMDKFHGGKVLGVANLNTPHGQICPRMSGMFGGFFLLGNDPGGPIYGSLPVVNGTMLLATRGYRQIRKLIRIGTDGSSRGESMIGPVVSRHRSHVHGANEIAVSPDGAWIYITGLGTRHDGGWNRIPGHDWSDAKRSGQRCRHAVYRLAWGEKGPIGRPFVGEENLWKYSRGKDNRHFDFPTGLACDAKGRLYVSDYGNSRIQVFSPKGEYLKTIPCKQPWQLAVHPENGSLYVHCYPNTSGDGFQARIVKFAGFDNPRVVKTWAIPNRRAVHKKAGTPRPLFCLDAWMKPARVWLTNCGAVQMYEETEKGFKLLLDFPKKVAADGYTPGCMGPSYRNRLTVFPGGPLYFSRGKSAYNLTRVDPEVGKRFQPVHMDWGGTFNLDEVIAGVDGYFYARGVAFLGRFKPPARPHQEGGVALTPGDEVVFDYGETVNLGSRNATLRGAIRIPSVPGGNYENMGVNVSPRGDIIAYAKVYGRALKYNDRGNLGGGGEAKLNEVAMRAYLEFQKNSVLYNPVFRPGVLSGGELVFTWDRKGELLGEDLVSAPGGSCGLAMDKDRNLYVGIGVAPHKPAPFAYGGRSGIVAKFPPTGGKIYGGWGPLPLKGDAAPKRPPEFDSQGAKLWSRDMYWSFPGVGAITPGTMMGCTCPQSRFHLDLYGRSFLPMAWRYTVAVLDTNGNPIFYVGRYGNADSGRGPDSPVKVKGGIALAHCSFLAVDSDHWLYLNDSGNNRIVRVKMAYANEKRVPLAGN